MEKIYERLANLEREYAYFDLNLMAIRKRLGEIEKRLATLQDYDISAQETLKATKVRITTIEGKLEYLESELDAPDKNFVAIQHRVKETEDWIRKFLRGLHDLSDS